MRGWWVWVAAVLLGALAGVGYGLLAPQTWSASAFVVVVPVDPAAEDAGTALNLAQGYGRVVDQPQVMGAAAQRLGEDPTELGAAVTASTSPDAPLIELVATGASPTEAADRANAVADALVAFGRTQEASTGVRTPVFSAAQPPAQPSSASPALSGALGAAAGLLLGGLAVLTEAGRGRRRAAATDPSAGRTRPAPPVRRSGPGPAGGSG